MRGRPLSWQSYRIIATRLVKPKTVISEFHDHTKRTKVKYSEKNFSISISSGIILGTNPLIPGS